VLLNGLSLGDGNSYRTGQSIKGISGQIRFAVSVNSTSLQNLVRVIVLRDKQPNSVAPNIGNILTSTSCVADYTIGGQKRYEPLYDETFALSVYGPGLITKAVKYNFNWHVEYNTGNAGDITDINSESIYLIYFSNQGVNYPNIYYYNRLYFVDN